MWLVIVLSLIGHLGLWATIFNQMHATAWNRAVRKAIEKVIYLMVVGLGIWLTIWTVGYQSQPFVRTARSLGSEPATDLVSILLVMYQGACLLFSFVFMIRWLLRQLDRLGGEPRVVKQQTKNRILIGKSSDKNMLHGWQASLLGWIPGNQVLQLSIEEKSLRIPDLPKSLNGLRIAHLSDLHFTGKIGIDYFHEVVRQVNLLRADFVCLTGDIVDERECLPWIHDVLGKVECEHAKLFVLGNHDCRIKDEKLLRGVMAENGWTDPGGDWKSYPIGGATVSFAGNEAPWFKQGLATPARIAAANELLVLLSHSPDQFRWAQKRKFKLVLAGHCHGGQIRFPVIGPVIAPSIHGVKYASGVFEANGTAMQVSRGVSGDDPIRWNCPPELALITLARL